MSGHSRDGASGRARGQDVLDGHGVQDGHDVQDGRDVHDGRVDPDLAAQLAALECAYAHSPVGLAVIDLELRYVRVNQAIAEMNGLAVDDVVGKRYRDLAPETADLAESFFRLVARRGQSIRNLEVKARPRGDPEREHIYLVSLDPMRDAAGETIGLISAVQDVTDLRQAEERASRRLLELVTSLAERQRELEALRDRLTEAQRVASVGSWEWNVLEDEVWWSPELFEIFGEPHAYVPSYDGFFEHVHPSDRSRVREQIESTVRDGASYHLTYRILAGDGSERVLFTVARLERTPDGQPARLIGTCQNITRFGPPGRKPTRRGRGGRAEGARPVPGPFADG